MRRRLRAFFEHIATECVIGALILISVALTLVEVSFRLPSPWGVWLPRISQAITAIFVCELFLRWVASRSSAYYFRHHWLDLMALLPLIRPLRMLRILRLLRLVRLGLFVTRRMRRVGAAIHEGLAENVLLLIAVFLIFLCGTIGITVAEQGNPDFDSLGETVWWTIVTLITGEPAEGRTHTVLGKIFTVLVMLGGFTLFATFTGVISAVMVGRLKRGMEARAMELDELEGHTLLCGWNRSGPVVVAELQADRQTRRKPLVIVAEIEDEPDLPLKGIDRDLVYFKRGDFTSTEVLELVGVRRAARAILLADSSQPRSDQDRDARTLLAALTIEKLSPRIFTTAELLHRQNAAHLRLAGVEDVVVGNEYMGTVVAQSARTYGLTEILDEVLTSTRGNAFHKIRVPEELVGKTVLEAMAWLKAKHGALLVSIEAAPEANPSPGGESGGTRGRPYGPTFAPAPEEAEYEAGGVAADSGEDDEDRADGEGRESREGREYDAWPPTYRHGVTTNPPADRRLQSGEKLILIATACPKISKLKG